MKNLLSQFFELPNLAGLVGRIGDSAVAASSFPRSAASTDDEPSPAVREESRPGEHPRQERRGGERASRQRDVRQRLVDQTPGFVDFSRTEVERSIPCRFLRQVEAHGARLAIVTEDCRWTYEDLGRITNLIARKLLECQGPGPEPVLLLQSQGAPHVAAILGTLRAGKFHVPLDPSHSEEHLQAVRESTAASIIVTDSRHRERAAHLAGETGIVIDLEELDFAAAAEPVELPVDPDATAYVIFTSGTTGAPKGCMQTHRNVLHYIRNYTNSLRIGPEDRLSLLAGPAYSAAAMDVFAALLNGATLYPWSMADHGLSGLAGWLVRNEITVYHSTATVFRCLLGLLTDEDDFPKLRVIDLGGDTAHTLDAERFQKRFPAHGVLVIGYGLSELNVISQYLIDRETPLSGNRVPIGYPVEDTEVLILNDAGEVADAGEVGEIALKSKYLSTGYWGNPEATAAAHWDDPTGSGARFYRTGDAGRILEDGCVEHLGRKTSRRKFQGRWIDLDEMEGAVRRCPSVRDALVISHEGSPGETRIVACFVPDSDPPPTVSALRRDYMRALPGALVPHRFIAIESLPLTSNGKLDRSFRVELATTRPRLDVVHVGPRNPLETTLAGIWSDLLEVDGIGVHDDFFELGGDSLLAFRAIARVHSQLNVDLSPGQWFEAPTIAALAAEIHSRERGESRKPASPPRRIERERFDRLPLSIAQRRLWYLEQVEGGLAGHHLPFNWRLRGPLQTEALRRALEALIHRHEPLRTTFTVVDGEPGQVPRTIDRWELPLEDLQGLSKDQQAVEVERRCQEEAERPFDLTQDLMLRGLLLRLADDEHVLLLTLHHLATDGWSMREVFWPELGKLYEAYRTDGDATLSGLPVQYVDYAVWHRKRLENGRLADSLNHWREQLRNLRALELPTDRPRPTRPSVRGARHHFELGPEVVARLRALCRDQGVTPQMALLAVFQVLLSRYTGQDDVAVGTPAAGRSHEDLEGLVGFFVNTLVIRADLSGNPTFRELLDRVRRVSLAAYDHQDVPFEKLVEDLRPERLLDRGPLVQVLFQLMGFSERGLVLSELEAIRLPEPSCRARFDLEMRLWQPMNQGDVFQGTLVYSPETFDAATIERLAGHYLTLLEGVVADADQPIGTLPLLTEAERHQLLVEWNDTSSDEQRDKCAHQIFEEWAERAPDAVAIAFEDVELTYRELNERANQLARHLRSLGVGPETLVGLCLERSPDLVVGILGILKAGGAYVPLDAEDPRRRLEFILRDTELAFLVTKHRFLDGIPAGDHRVVLLDADATRLERMDRSSPPRNVGAENLAYVMYTSGSTGEPKGVAVQHASIVRLVFGNDYARFGPDRVFLLLATVSFDASIFETWGALLHGAKLVVAPPAFPTSPSLKRSSRDTG